jgi:hypothetical protein
VLRLVLAKPGEQQEPELGPVLALLALPQPPTFSKQPSSPVSQNS